MKIRRLAHALGAEVLDVDLSAALEPATFRAIRQAWIEHLVLVFPGQDRLTPDAHVAFSRLFGTLDRNEVTPSYRLPGYEEVKSKRIMEFRSPRDMAGAKDMSVSFVDHDREDSGWLYMPAQRKPPATHPLLPLTNQSKSGDD